MKEQLSFRDVQLGATEVLKKLDDIAFCNLTSRDVVRHPLVQKIVKAYDDFEQRKAERRSSRKNNRRNQQSDTRK